MDDGRDPKYRYMRLVGTATMVPFLLAAGPLVGFFIGRFLDSLFGTEPVLKWILLGLGFVAGIREVIRLLQKISRDMDRM